MTLTHGDPKSLVDIPALMRLLTQTETEIRSLKGELRTTWKRPMASEQQALGSLKTRATQLCALRARCRGRLHIAQKPRHGMSPLMEWDAAAYNGKLAERALALHKLERRSAS